jgi:hypothetical protein
MAAGQASTEGETEVAAMTSLPVALEAVAVTKPDDMNV